MENSEVTLLLYVLALNFFLSGLSKTLAVIKDKTATKVDDKIWFYVDRAAGICQAIVDFFSANPKH
jgi:hypothetical protein